MPSPPTATQTLARRRDPLALPSAQVRLLETGSSIPPFDEALKGEGLAPLEAGGIEIFQINMGKLCNQTCRHCHVDAGPDRTEKMSRETMDLCLEVLERTRIPTVDITGGAPELNPGFRRLVRQCRKLGCHVMDRCNLSVLLLPSQEDLAAFLAANRVEVVASLPYYLEEETDRQRGPGTFQRSMDGLRRLNEEGYGREGSDLVLNLVYNPVGAYLPPCQEEMERDYRLELHRRHGIVFNRLYTITNMPISRFLEFLVASGNYDRYMQRLAGAFNPRATAEVMCRSTLSVGWDGRLFDCDFNQMLDLPADHGAPAHIRDFDLGALSRRRIVTGRHCYGCTAGAGSSCGGTLDSP
jgi:radical SAM/Cys-rich protein